MHDSVTLLKAMLKSFPPFPSFFLHFSTHTFPHAVISSVLCQPLLLSDGYVDTNRLRLRLSDVTGDPEKMTHILKSITFYRECLSRVSGVQGTTEIKDLLGVM